MVCKNCNFEFSEEFLFCPKCGEKIILKSKLKKNNDNQLLNEEENNLKITKNNESKNEQQIIISPKSRFIASLLAFCFGWTGAHRFYLGNKKLGFFQLSLTVLFAILYSLIGYNKLFDDEILSFVWVITLISSTVFWSFIDYIYILLGKAKDRDKRVVQKWLIKNKISIMFSSISLVCIILYVFSFRICLSNFLYNKYYEAAEHGNLTKLKSFYYFMDITDFMQSVALEKACENGDLIMSTFLLEKGANPNLNSYNKTSLLCAIQSGSLEIVKLLIKSGVNVNKIGTYKPNNQNDDFFWKSEGRTPIMCASNNGNLQIVKLLIESGCDVNSKDNFGLTALHHASYMNNSNIIEYLILSGANVNEQTKDGYTSLMFAVNDNCIDATNVLLINKADMYIQNNEGKTAFNLAKQDTSKLLYRQRRLIYGY